MRFRPVKHRSAARGFTLIELLVAITIMALLAVLSWRGLDGMARAQSQTSQRADEILTLQSGLSQWKLDLDAMTGAPPTGSPQINSLDWDGRVLRLTRRTIKAGDGLQVVAWTRRSDNGGQWLRWQSPVLRTVPAWTEAWARASAWAQNAGSEDRKREVPIAGLEDWQIFYYRGGAWSNPLSSDGDSSGSTASGQTQGAVPDGIRVILTLPSNQAISGKLTMDWVRPTLAGARS